MTKSNERIKKNGEVFTPRWLVDDMLNKFPEDAWLPEKTWLEPAAGDGNFVERIIERRIEMGHDPYQILKTVFAVELMQDNVELMKERALAAAGLEDCEEAKKIGILDKLYRKIMYFLLSFKSITAASNLQDLFKFVKEQEIGRAKSTNTTPLTQ